MEGTVLKFRCSRCQQRLWMPKGTATRQIVCVHCGKVMTAPGATSPAPPPAATQEPLWPWLAGVAAILVLAVVVGYLQSAA